MISDPGVPGGIKGRLHRGGRGRLRGRRCRRNRRRGWGCRRHRGQIDLGLGLALRRTGCHAHGEVGCAVDTYSVAPQVGFGHGGDAAIVVALEAGNLHLRRDLLVRRHDLTAVSPADRFVQRDRLEARRGAHLFAEPTIEHRELDELEHHLDAQRPRLNGVAVEVRLEVPLGRIDILDRTPPAQAEAAIGAPASGHPVDHQQHRVGQPGSGAEELLRPGTQVDDRRRTGQLQQGTLFFADREPHLLLQRFEAEVSEDGVERVDGPVIVGDFAVEGRDDGSAGLGDALQRGRDPQCPGGRRDLPVLHSRPVEVAEEQVHVEVQRTTGVGADPAAGLQGDLHEDRVGHRQLPVRALVLGEIPRVAGDVVFRDDRSASLRDAELTDHLGDSRHEVVGRSGEPGDPAVSVELLVERPDRQGGLGHGASEHRLQVKLDSVALGDGLGLDVSLQFFEAHVHRAAG